MEKYDRNLEQRVWERIHGEVPREPELRNLPALIAAEGAAAAMYHTLARRVQGHHRQTLLRMAKEEEAHRDALMGMYYMTTGRHYSAHTPTPVQSPLSAALRKCYAGELKSMAAYAEHSADPEYGTAFRHIAKDEEMHSRWLLEILGALAK